MNNSLSRTVKFPTDASSSAVVKRVGGRQQTTKHHNASYWTETELPHRPDNDLQMEPVGLRSFRPSLFLSHTIQSASLDALLPTITS